MKTSFHFPAVICMSFLFLAGCTSPVKVETPPESTNAESRSMASLRVEEPSAVQTGENSAINTTEETSQSAGWTVESQAEYSSQENPHYINIYLAALEDGGKSGPLTGCNDSLIAVQVKYSPAKGQDAATDALTKLFAVKQQFYGQSGLYNALYQSNLKVDSLTADAGKKATLMLSGTMQLGGVCDSPRFENQIKATVLQFKDLYSDVEIFVNGKPLKDLLSEK